MVDSKENYKFDLGVRELHNHSINPFTPKISLVILHYFMQYVGS